MATKLFVSAIALVLLCAGAAFGDVITLTDAYYISDLPGGQLTVGDKVFSDFAVTPTAFGGAVAPDASSIKVQGVQVDYGSGFQYGLAFFGGWSAAPQQIVDTVVLFRVTAEASYMISGGTLWLATGDGVNGGQASISQSIYSSYPGPELASLYVFKNGSGSDIVDDGAFTNLSRSIWATQGIQTSGGPDPSGSAAISLFYATFDQVAAPEPFTMGLLLAGGVGLLVRRRR